jgi:hypothetical protein
MEYAIVETLNGNYRLKELSKVKDTDSIEIELYGYFDKVQKEYKNHIKELKEDGLY